MTIYLAGLADRPKYPGQYYSITVSKKMPYPRLDMLAPTWLMVENHKLGFFSDEEYTEEYGKLLQRRKRELSALFRWLTPDEDQVWLCFCPQYETRVERTYEIRKFCHRLLVAKLLRAYRPDIPIEVH